MAAVITRVQVEVVQEGICFVVLPGEVNKGEIVICKARNVLRDTTIDVLTMSIIFEVFVIHVDSDGVSSAYQ